MGIMIFIAAYIGNYLFQITFDDNLYRYNSNNDLVIMQCKKKINQLKLILI